MRQAHIDIFSDPVCPWCLVGLARLDQTLADLNEQCKIGITHHPFLLDADTPKEGEDVVAMLKRKYGRAPDEMWDRLEQEAKTCGLALDMRKQKMRYPSQKALALIMAAKADDALEEKVFGDKASGNDAHRQHNLARSISHACYMQGLNIADEAVLMDIALAHGFDAQKAHGILSDDQAVADVEKNARWAPQAGITGVPYFIFNNKFALSGAQPKSVFEEALTRALSMERVAVNPE